MMRLWARLTLLQRFTVVSAVIAVSLAVSLSVVMVRVITAFVIQDEAHVAAELVLRTFSPQLQPGDLKGTFPAARKVLLDSLFLAHGVSDKILRVRLWRHDGALLYTNTPDSDRSPTVPADLSTPEGYRRFVNAREGLEGEVQGQARIFVPVTVDGGRTLGAFEIFYDLTVLRERLAYTTRIIWTAVPAGLFVLYASVFVLVRRTSRLLLTQQADLVTAHLGTYHALAGAIDAKDSYTGDHSVEVSRLAVALGRAIGLGGEILEDLRMAAHLHDLGKIAVPDAILTKQGPLTDEEFAIIRRHADAGYAILRDAPLSERVKLAVRHNHERWDGAGYPSGLAGEAIPLFSRILAIVDGYEAMTSDRPYRRAMPRAEAVGRLRAGAGTQFDPELVEVFLHGVLTSSDAAAYTDMLRSVVVSGTSR
ncbi:MAG TPA: HD-GYP domain-containing protein [bacterium]|jgi:putative nucleotidyltransferase with HDIG domain|nr:HD-GYP domain-containing protein [bacterium]